MTQLHVYFQHRWLFALLVGLGIWGQAQVEAKAHGAYIQTRNITTVEIQANYDSGEPMAEAQVVVYGPTDSNSPRFEGISDQEGRFRFTPDQPGAWEVTVRQAGHGAISSIPISEEGIVTTSSGNSQLTLFQQLVIGGVVIWGAVGTALYFRRNKS